MKNLCTVYDIQICIPELYSKETNMFMEPMGLLLDNIRTQSVLIQRKLSQYFSNLQVTPYLTYPLGHIGNHNRDSFVKIPTLLITDTTASESDTFIITFIDNKNFSIVNFFGVSSGNGITTSDFTASGGLFKIYSTDWQGVFDAGDKFFFGYENYEDTLRLLGTYAAACKLLKGRYINESANAMGALSINYCKEVDKILNDIINTGEIVLECQQSDEGQLNLNSRESWQGYNIDEYGLQQDPPN